MRPKIFANVSKHYAFLVMRFDNEKKGIDINFY